MRHELTKPKLREVMKELGRTAPRNRTFRVYLVGGGTAVYVGWRASSIDADLHADEESVFRDIQGIKERLNVNVEFSRPEHFVPPLPGTEDRHVFVETMGRVSFFHYDPYAQVLSKITRGFERDLTDAHAFVASGMVAPHTLRSLVEQIPDATYARYPNLSRLAVIEALEAFLDDLE